MTVYAYWDAGVSALATLNEPPEGVSFTPFDDDVDVNDLYVSGGEIRLRPPRPEPWMIFDPTLGEWIDPRTPATWTEELIARRAAASMTRLDFTLACVMAGILSEADALVAVDGGFPPAFEAIIEDMPPEQSFQARMRWKGATEIDRTNPLIVDMAAAINVNEWMLDQVFGIEWPAPLADWPEGQLHP